MPDLDNMAKAVKGPWKKAVHAAITAPEKIGQALANVLSHCAVKLAGEGQLPEFSDRLTQLAALPQAGREMAFRQMQFPVSPEGRDIAATAARNVGKMICAGQVAPAEVARALAREFLLTITRTEFFGRLTAPDMTKLFGSVDGARAHLLAARQEVEDFASRAAPEFAASTFERIEKVQKPELPKQTTEQQMAQDVEISISMNDEDP